MLLLVSGSNVVIGVFVVLPLVSGGSDALSPYRPEHGGSRSASQLASPAGFPEHSPGSRDFSQSTIITWFVQAQSSLLTRKMISEFAFIFLAGQRTGRPGRPGPRLRATTPVVLGPDSVLLVFLPVTLSSYSNSLAVWPATFSFLDRLRRTSPPSNAPFEWAMGPLAQPGATYTPIHHLLNYLCRSRRSPASVVPGRCTSITIAKSTKNTDSGYRLRDHVDMPHCLIAATCMSRSSTGVLFRREQLFLIVYLWSPSLAAITISALTSSPPMTRPRIQHISFRPWKALTIPS